MLQVVTIADATIELALMLNAKGSTENNGNGDNPQLKTEDLAQRDQEPNNQNQQEVNREERNRSWVFFSPMDAIS